MSRTASDTQWLRVLPLLLALVILPTPQVPASAADTSGVTGIVTNNETGSPVVRASVTVYAPGQRVPLMTTTSDSTGRYAIRGLSSGDYVLRASAHGFATIFSGGSPTWQHADPVSLSDGDTRTQDFALSPAARITGSVTSGGAPVHSVAIAVLRAVDGTAVRWQRTDADGSYAIGGLPAGSYKVRAQKPGYLRSFHDGSATVRSASALTLPVGGSVTVPFTLVPEGAIAGRVTDRSGTPIAEALITGFDADGEVAGSVRSDAASNYRLRGLRAGEYLLRAGAPEFKASFYGPATSLGSATPILVHAGRTVAGVDVALAERSTSDAVSSLPDDPTAGSAELGAYSWVQVLRSGGDAAMAAQLVAWAERGGDLVIVDVSARSQTSQRSVIPSRAPLSTPLPSSPRCRSQRWAGGSCAGRQSGLVNAGARIRDADRAGLDRRVQPDRAAPPSFAWSSMWSPGRRAWAGAGPAQPPWTLGRRRARCVAGARMLPESGPPSPTGSTIPRTPWASDPAPSSASSRRW